MNSAEKLIHGRLKHLESHLDDVDGAVDAGAEAAGIGEQNVHGRQDSEWAGGVQTLSRLPLRPAG